MVFPPKPFKDVSEMAASGEDIGKWLPRPVSQHVSFSHCIRQVADHPAARDGVSSHVNEIVIAKSVGPFTMIPWIITHELAGEDDEKLLFLTYAIASKGSPLPVSIGIRHGVKESGVSKNRFIKTRNSLEAKGYIKVTKTPGNQADIVEVLWAEIWDRNGKMYLSPEKVEEQAFDAVDSLPEEVRMKLFLKLAADLSMSPTLNVAQEQEESDTSLSPSEHINTGDCPQSGTSLSPNGNIHIYIEK